MMCDDCDAPLISYIPPQGDGNCKECHGEGSVRTFLISAVQEALGAEDTDTCETCSGTGQCQTCGGTGIIEDEDDEE